MPLVITHGIFLRFLLIDILLGDRFGPADAARLWQMRTVNCGLSAFDFACATGRPSTTTRTTGNARCGWSRWAADRSRRYSQASSSRRRAISAACRAEGVELLGRLQVALELATNAPALSSKARPLWASSAEPADEHGGEDAAAP